VKRSLHDLQSCMLDNTAIKVNGRIWSALRISAGEEGYNNDPVAVVAPLSTELAKNHIAIYYLSTFTSDFTLVLEGSLGRAVQVLNKNLGAIIDLATVP